MSAMQDRIDAVRDRVDITHVIGAAVELRGGGKPRGKCPFHGSRSESLAVYPDNGTAKCWGCDWHGDAIGFVRDFYGLSFVEALERLEGELNLSGLDAQPVYREKIERPKAQRDVEYIDSLTMGRWIWKTATPHPEAVRIYLRARGVPEHLLGADRLEDVRFHGLAPISAWPLQLVDGKPQGPPKDCPKAPAIVALVRRPPEWQPIGAHVTFLAPDLIQKMRRRRPGGGDYPARKMLGHVEGGCVLLGRYASDRPLFVGEGIETVLSGMAIAGAAADDIGLAALSLNTLQGHWKRWRNGVTPLFDIKPDPERSPALAFAHDGPVTGLIDADMQPLWAARDRITGERIGFPLVERREGAIVRRAISPIERAEICGELFVQAWRNAGCTRVKAVRPKAGQDFNDAIREVAA